METSLATLPVELLEKTFLCLSYEEVAQMRLVSKMFNYTCMALLNKGFRAVEKFHDKCFKEVKAKLPRRESERRGHKLGRHCDILTAIETRISLLSMTFLKYVDMNLCCFIPGKVIDEIFTVLRCIQDEETPPRAFEVLQELRDISSMAIEHFDENIAPSLQLPLSPVKFGSTGFSLNLQYPATPTGQQIATQSLLCPASEPSRGSRSLLSLGTEREARSCKKLIKTMKRKSNSFKVTVSAQNKKIVEMDRKINQQDETIHQQNTRLVEQDEKLAEMGRKLAVMVGGGVKRGAEDFEGELESKKRKVEEN